jgi:dihydrofolate reductase
MTEIPLVLVAAVAENGVIGRDGALPWRLPSDLKHFRALTLGHPVVMGRRTFQSIGAPLPGRANIVVSRDPVFAAPGAVVARSLGQALETATGEALRRGAGAVMIIGGAEIYRMTMPRAARLEITRVHASPAGDAFFPAIDPAQWREEAREDRPAAPGDETAFAFVRYERIGSAPAPSSASPRGTGAR